MTLREEFERATGKQFLTEEMQDDIVIANYTCDYVHWLEKKLTSKLPTVDGKEYTYDDIISIHYDYKESAKKKLKKALMSCPTSSMFELMGFEPVKGKENAYVKVKY